MAKIEQPQSSGFRITDLAPVGQYVAVCLRVEDQFGVERTKFQSLEKEHQDVTRFLFGFFDQSGRPHLVQTFEFKISGAPGANLMKFLTSWIGRCPEYGWDYCEMKGAGAMIAVNHRTSKSQPPVTYSSITGIFPVPQQMIAYVPESRHFDALVAAAEAGNNSGHQAPPTQQAMPPQSAPPQGMGYAQAPPQGYMPPQAPHPGMQGQPTMPPQGGNMPPAGHAQAPGFAPPPVQQQAPGHLPVQGGMPPMQGGMPYAQPPMGDFPTGGDEFEEDQIPF